MNELGLKEQAFIGCNLITEALQCVGFKKIPPLPPSNDDISTLVVYVIGDINDKPLNVDHSHVIIDYPFGPDVSLSGLNFAQHQQYYLFQWAKRMTEKLTDSGRLLLDVNARTTRFIPRAFTKVEMGKNSIGKDAKWTIRITVPVLKKKPELVGEQGVESMDVVEDL